MGSRSLRKMKDYVVAAEGHASVIRFSHWDADMQATEWRRSNPQLAVTIRPATADDLADSNIR